tara:strand:- start:524 stop:1723 length:1200 start_codon:yes stop_codon:yes gene_type:complete
VTSLLNKIKVIDMSRVLAGPWAGQLLGDYGADVIKIERPITGDDTRQWGPPWLGKESGYFMSTNRNKRSITVDISSIDGQEVIKDLVLHADILIENYKVGTLSRYGLSSDDLLKINPKLIFCSISAYGQTGSRADQPGYDAMIQASAGLMSVTGPSEGGAGGPQKVGVAISDIMAGMYAVTAILAALNSRTNTGKGQYIDVPLYDTQVAWLANQNMNYLLNKISPKRMGTAHPNLVPYQVFSTSNGDLMLAVGNDAQFKKCCDALGLDYLKKDDRFFTMSKRIKNRNILIEILQKRFLNDSAKNWLAKLLECKVPAGPVNDIKEVLTNEYAVEKNLVKHIKSTSGYEIPLVSNPVCFEHTPVEYKLAPPLLGEHTDKILNEWLGYSDSKVNSLKKSGVI